MCDFETDQSIIHRPGCDFQNGGRLTGRAQAPRESVEAISGAENVEVALKRALRASTVGKLQLELLDLACERRLIVAGTALGVFVTVDLDLALVPFFFFEPEVDIIIIIIVIIIIIIIIIVVVVVPCAHSLAHELDVIGIHRGERLGVDLSPIELASELLELSLKLVRASEL